jgi:dCTP diphosphatase
MAAGMSGQGRQAPVGCSLAYTEVTMTARTRTDLFRDLATKVKQFAADRDWDQFHSPKNLCMALSVECAELMEHFQWLSEEQSRTIPPDTMAEVKDELADVFIYVIRLSQVLGVDLLAAGHSKLSVNAAKYPVEKSRGSAKKYSRLT